jgi:hypothetical protein
MAVPRTLLSAQPATPKRSMVEPWMVVAGVGLSLALVVGFGLNSQQGSSSSGLPPASLAPILPVVAQLPLVAPTPSPIATPVSQTPAPASDSVPTSLAPNAAETTTLVADLATEQQKEETVYITKTGKKYHAAGCRYIAKNSSPMPLSEALKRFSPCSVCGPLTSSRSAQLTESSPALDSSPAPPASRSNYRTSSSDSSGEKTVHVRGYTRKNGTVVQPYMRRAPRR